VETKTEETVLNRSRRRLVGPINHVLGGGGQDSPSERGSFVWETSPSPLQSIGIIRPRHSYSIGGSSDAAFSCQFYRDLFICVCQLCTASLRAAGDDCACVNTGGTLHHVTSFPAPSSPATDNRRQTSQDFAVVYPHLMTAATIVLRPKI